MVDQGWALAYRRYSMDYVDEENAAASTHRGIWRGSFMPPWEWRRAH
jgi:endonuclease YncB( thermonuclease family)